MKRFVYIIFLFTIINILYAQDGTIDTEFGINGKISIHVPDINLRSKTLLVLDDDSFLAGINLEYNHYGNYESRGFNIYKFDKNGLLDTSFGENGLLFFPNEGNKRSFIISLDRYNDKIFVHYLYKDVNMVSIINFSGEILKSFEIDGGINYYTNIKFQSGQKFIVSGTKNINHVFVPIFQRYSFDGQKDMNFGTNGEVRFEDLNYTYFNCHDFDIDTNGSILIIGDAGNYGEVSRPFILKYDENGRIDTSFASQGKYFFHILDNSYYGYCKNVKVLPDNKILVSIEALYPNGTGGWWGKKPAIVRLNSDGSFDTSFANNGKHIFETYHNANDSFRCMNIQPDGKILIGGGSSYPFPIFDTDYYMIRLQSNGSLDTGFANNGFFVSDFNGHETCYIFDIQLQKHAILALGVENTTDNFNTDASIIRFKAPSLTEFSQVSSIYPNPFDKQVTVRNSSFFDKIEVFNLLGQLVLKETFDEVKKYLIDTKNLKKGMYNLILYHKNHLVDYKKLIKH